MLTRPAIETKPSLSCIVLMRCLNLDTEPPALRPVLGLYAALYLKEILDRIDFPPPDEIPDAKTVESRKLASWTLPQTEITISEVKDKNSYGRFLFSPDTVKRSEDFYEKVRDLPYKPGAQGALYKQLTSSAGPIVSKETNGSAAAMEQDKHFWTDCVAMDRVDSIHPDRYGGCSAIVQVCS